MHVSTKAIRSGREIQRRKSTFSTAWFSMQVIIFKGTYTCIHHILILEFPSMHETERSLEAIRSELKPSLYRGVDNFTSEGAESKARKACQRIGVPHPLPALHPLFHGHQKRDGWSRLTFSRKVNFEPGITYTPTVCFVSAIANFELCRSC